MLGNGQYWLITNMLGNDQDKKRGPRKCTLAVVVPPNLFQIADRQVARGASCPSSEWCIVQWCQLPQDESKAWSSPGSRRPFSRDCSLFFHFWEIDIPELTILTWEGEHLIWSKAWCIELQELGPCHQTYKIACFKYILTRLLCDFNQLVGRIIVLAGGSIERRHS